MEKYHTLMFHGTYDDPLCVACPNATKSVVLTGYGASRHINIYIDNGLIVLPVDLNEYDSINVQRAYIATSEIKLTGTVDGRIVLRLMERIQFGAYKVDECFYWFTEAGLDSLFDFICDEL